MMRWTLIILLLPVAVYAQEFQFQQEFDTIPVEINGWRPYQPWIGGLSRSTPATADIDSDGDLDLFIGDYTGNLTYLRNDGDSTNGNFRYVSSSFDSIRVYFESNPCFKDIDNDGDDDLFITDNNAHLLYYCNMGTAYQPDLVFVDTIFTIGPPWCMGPELVDIDADGDFDLFGGSYGQINYWRNDGTAQQYSFTFSIQLSGINVGDRALPDFIDIDADTDLDLFVGNYNGNIYFYRNDGDSSQYNFTYITNNYAGINVGGYASPEFADLDGDGDYDLLVGREQPGPISNAGDIWYYQNVGSPTLPQWNLVTKNYLCIDEGNRASSAMTDIDADSDQDLFIFNGSSNMTFFQNAGTPTFSHYRWITDTYQNIHVNYGSPFFKDIDADVDPDLFVGEAVIPNPPYPHLFLYSNQGTPQMAIYTTPSSLVPGNYYSGVYPALADIDADGDQDLFLSVNDGSYYYFENTGTPAQAQFPYGINNWQGISTDNGVVSCFYDIDTDGDLDLFLGKTFNYNQLWFYKNMGSPFNAQMTLINQYFLGPGKTHFSGVNIFDIDGDGDGDFLVSSSDGGMQFFRNITGQGVHPNPKRPAPTEPIITILPNPGNSSLVARYSLLQAGNVSLKVYDIAGRMTGELFYGFQFPGTYNFTWDASEKASGIYLIRLETSNQTATRKVTIVK